MMRHATALAALASIVAVTGCESVPTLTFVEGGGADADQSAHDGATDLLDSAKRDGTSGCTGTCCPTGQGTSIECIGNCPSSACQRCVSLGCPAAKVCCAKNPNDVSCTDPSACPY